MDECILDGGSNLHADTSFSGQFVLKGRVLQFGTCASHDIKLCFLNKLKTSKIAFLRNLHNYSILFVCFFFPERFLVKSFTI